VPFILLLSQAMLHLAIYSTAISENTGDLPYLRNAPTINERVSYGEE
jgi:hypothetical protein